MLSMLLNDGTTLERSMERIRHGNDAKLIVGELVVSDQPKSDPQIIILLKAAHRARALATARPNFALGQLAKTFGRSTERYKRLLRLSYLSPTIVSTIIEAGQPAHLTGRFLQTRSPAVELGRAGHLVAPLSGAKILLPLNSLRPCHFLCLGVDTYVAIIWRKSAKTSKIY